MSMIDKLVQLAADWFKPTVRSVSKLYNYDAGTLGTRQFVLNANINRVGWTIQLFIPGTTVPARVQIYCPNEAGDSGQTGLIPIGELVSKGHAFDASPVCREYTGPVQIAFLSASADPLENLTRVYVTEWLRSR